MTDVNEPAGRHDARKRFDAIWWAVTLIWVGLVLGARFLDILPEIGEGDEWWPWIFIGIAPWSIALNLYRVTSASAPNPTTWDWVWTVIFSAVALGVFIDIGGELVGAVVLIGIGAVVLIRTVTNRPDQGVHR